MKAKIAANNKNSLFVEKLKYLYVLFNILLVLINDGLAKTAKKGIIDEIPTISRMAIITDKKNKSNNLFFSFGLSKKIIFRKYCIFNEKLVLNLSLGKKNL